MDQIEKTEVDFKNVRADWRRVLEDLKEKRRLATLAFRIGAEDREMLCDEQIDWQTRKATYFFEGKIVRTRDLDPNEQEPLFENDQPTEKVEKLKLNKNGHPIIEQPSASKLLEIKTVMKQEKSKNKKDLTL